MTWCSAWGEHVFPLDLPRLSHHLINRTCLMIKTVLWWYSCQNYLIVYYFSKMIMLHYISKKVLWTPICYTHKEISPTWTLNICVLLTITGLVFRKMLEPGCRDLSLTRGGQTNIWWEGLAQSWHFNASHGCWMRLRSGLYILSNHIFMDMTLFMGVM